MKAIILLSVLLGVGTAHSVAAEEAVDAATHDKLAAMLAAKGYVVRRIDAEDGLIEVYALKDGHKLEIYFDHTLRQVEVREMDD